LHLPQSTFGKSGRTTFIVHIASRLPGSPLQSAHPTTRRAWRALLHGIADVIRPERPQLAHAILSTSGLRNQVAKDDAPSRGIVGVLAVFWRSNTSFTQ